VIGRIDGEDRGAADRVASRSSDRPVQPVAGVGQLQILQGDAIFGTDNFGPDGTWVPPAVKVRRG
jgi:hypothetical protein